MRYALAGGQYSLGPVTARYVFSLGDYADFDVRETLHVPSIGVALEEHLSLLGELVLWRRNTPAGNTWVDRSFNVTLYAGFEVVPLEVRELPAESLIKARIDDPAIAAALELVDRADGLVVVTPVYKAAYSGVLKTFLDLLPQFGLAGKVALPLATGGTLAHVLAIDYALRPLLAALDTGHIVGGLFLLDKLLERRPDNSLQIDPQLANRLHAVIDGFITAVRRARTNVATPLLPGQQPSSSAAAPLSDLGGLGGPQEGTAHERREGRLDGRRGTSPAT